MMVGAAALSAAVVGPLLLTQAAHAATPSPTAGGSDLFVSVVPQEAQAVPGGTVRIRIDFGNNGPRGTTGARITYTAPLGSTLRNAPAGWLVVGNSASQTLGTLGPAARRTVVVTLAVPAGATPGVRLVGGGARITPTTATTDPAGNNTSASRILVSPPKKSLTPTPTPTPTPPPTPTPTIAPTVSPTTSPRSPAPTTARPTGVRTVAAAPFTPGSPVGGSPTSGPSGVFPTGAATGESEPGGASPSPSAATLTVVDEPQSPQVRLLPLLGSLACFTGAGIGAAFLYRRRPTW